MAEISALDIVVLAGGISHERDISLAHRAPRRRRPQLAGPPRDVPRSGCLAARLPRGEPPRRGLARAARRERRRRRTAGAARADRHPVRRLTHGRGAARLVEADGEDSSSRVPASRRPRSVTLPQGDVPRARGRTVFWRRCCDGLGASARRQARAGRLGAGRDDRRRRRRSCRERWSTPTRTRTSR